MIVRTFCFLAVALVADPPPPQLIASIQKRVIASFERPPNCVCRQTLERSPGGPLRMDVGLIDGREQYSWPGSKKFDDASLDALVKAGAVSNGAYAVYPRNLFLKRGAKFDYKGQEAVGSRKAHRFDFVVPGEVSTFALAEGGRKYLVAYHGSLWADAQSSDLVRLEAAADNIPAELMITSSEARIEYHQVALGDDEYTLPGTVELTMATRRGGFHTISRFEECHPFTEEMVAALVGDDSADDQEEKKPEQQEVVKAAPTRAMARPAKQPAAPPPAVAALRPNVEVPPGLRLEIALTTPVLSEAGARVGDPVVAVLTGPLESGTRTLFPVDAQLTGNVLVLDKRRSEYFDFYVVGLRFDWIVDGASRAAFSAELEQVPIATEGYVFLPYHHLATQVKT
ncbi:MAG: hypothetical protein NTY38_33510, partial [Acidobacteria bacterium]|nr:hypothetical protein [Acidobacteriota bacterium]